MHFLKCKLFANSDRQTLSEFFRTQIEWANELYHSNDESVSTNYFSDLSVSYRTKSYETGLQCSNLFGTREYRRHYTTRYTDVVVLNHLRPREFFAKLLFNI